MKPDDASDRQAWLMLPTEAEVKPYLGQGHPYDFGFVAGMSRLIMAHAEIAPFFGGLFRQIMFQEGTLTRREREMVAAVAAAAQDCFY
jgi:alkylhydroperoxidase/carboxymuconolactone decarboxylase family protein YurZ